MATKGVMQQIQERVAQGKSSQEVISLGYAPGSVYKVQRQLRHSREEKEEPAAPGTAEAQVPVVNNEVLIRMGRLETENAQLRTQMAELRQEVEKVTSLQYQLDQLQWRFEELDTEVGKSQQGTFRQLQEQMPRIEALERQVQRLDEVVCLVSLLAYHLDAHHRQQIHGWPPDPADRDLQPSDEGYRTLQQQLRQWMTKAMTNFKQRRRFGLPIGFKGLAQDV